jgi:S-adenosylmethionine hydrolase
MAEFTAASTASTASTGATQYRNVSFTTDYGLDDGFVAACHGVIARIAPAVRVFDVTHTVGPQAVRQGAAVLAQTAPFLPESVHLAVVDPGVGTERRGVVVVAERGLLVGPDNGLLPPAAEALGGLRTAYELTEPRLRLPSVSATFHGRDVFAPAAAHLTLGVPPADFGAEMTDLVRLPAPLVVVEAGAMSAEVLTVDRFGNVQLAATPDDLADAGISGTAYVHGDRSAPGGHTIHNGLVTVGRTFGDVPPDEPVLYGDSAGRLALAVNGGSAAAEFGLSPAQVCTITASPTAS